MNNNDMLKPNGFSMSLDKVVQGSLNEFLEKHIKALELRKRDAENDLAINPIKHFLEGYILGINCAIQQLESSIKQIEK